MTDSSQRARLYIDGIEITREQEDLRVLVTDGDDGRVPMDPDRADLYRNLIRQGRFVLRGEDGEPLDLDPDEIDFKVDPRAHVEEYRPLTPEEGANVALGIEDGRIRLHNTRTGEYAPMPEGSRAGVRDLDAGHLDFRWDYDVPEGWDADDTLVDIDPAIGYAPVSHHYRSHSNLRDAPGQTFPLEEKAYKADQPPTQEMWEEIKRRSPAMALGAQMMGWGPGADRSPHPEPDGTYWRCVYPGCNTRINRRRDGGWDHGGYPETWGCPDHLVQPEADPYWRARLICDFCGTTEDVVWWLGASIIPGRERDDPNFAACDHCKVLLDEGRSDRTTERYLTRNLATIRRRAERQGLPPSKRKTIESELREQVRTFHDDFVANRNGAEERLEPEGGMSLGFIREPVDGTLRFYALGLVMGEPDVPTLITFGDR